MNNKVVKNSLKQVLLLVVALIVFVMPSSTANAALPQDSIFTAFPGTWSGKGTSFGMPSDISLIAENELQSQFIRLRYRLEMRSASGVTQIFEGLAIYKTQALVSRAQSNNQSQKMQRYTGIWYDNQGEIHPIAASADAQTLIAIWGEPSTKMGKTIYKFTDDKHIEITDFICTSDGTWKEFSRNTIQRK